MVDKSRLKPLSHKACAAIRCTGWMTVWEGAIRSGKTVSSLIAWLAYVVRSPEKTFFMSGKTLGSLIRNAIDGDFGFLALAHPHAVITKDRAGTAIIRIGEKTIYLFGAADDSSYERLKGLTAGGWYADEVATHPRSFIVEALARTAVSTDRRNFWTLNPTIPTHYIYADFLDLWEGQAGYKRFHFVLDDNLAMSTERKQELAMQYTGRYYSLYILGERVCVEGQIYSHFDTKTCVYSGKMPEADQVDHFICCDYGTINPCVFLDCCLLPNGTVCVEREYRWDSRKKMHQKTDSEFVDDMIKFVGAPEACDKIIVVDPSAASFILALKNAGYYVKGANNDVLPGIAKVSSLISQKRLKIHETCLDLINEMIGYSWDETAAQKGVERPLKIRDHGCDALRYYVNTCLTKGDLYGDF